MKKIILLILIAFGSVALRAQQTIPLQKTATLKVKDGKTENRQNVFGVFGVGNLNKEQLEKFNASGKFSCYIRPLIKKNYNLSFYLSFNKNATNNDSLLASTLIFPEVGNNSFLGTVEFATKIFRKI